MTKKIDYNDMWRVFMIKKIDYNDIMKKGFELLREEVDLVFGTDQKTQAESAIHMAGIIDMVTKLGELFEETEKEDN